MATKEELLERAKELDVEGRSSMNKEELEKAVAQAESSSQADTVADPNQGLRDQYAAYVEDRDPEADAEALNDESDTQVDPETYAEKHSEASDPDNPVVQQGLSESGSENLDKVEEAYGEDSAYVQESELALDASGPLLFQDPAKREMTGAVNEAHAKEQEELLKDLPDDHVGPLNELGQPLREVDSSSVSRKDNLSDNDDRVLYEVRQEDVIDFPPPVGERAVDFATRGDESGTEQGEGTVQQAAVAGTPFATGAVAGALGRTFQQKSVFYTDGLSETADHNLERAYEVPEVLQSNNPVVRAAGDESISEAAKDDQPDADKKRAEEVKNRDNE